jgi:DNA-binding transcriptional ArsR family regulator
MLIASEQLELNLKAKLFRGFGDPSRLRILSALHDTPLTVSKLVEVTGLTQSNVSNHLSCLKDCGLVVSEQSGRYVSYRLSDDRVAELLELVESFLADIASGIYECTRYNLPENGSSDTKG